MKGPARTRAAHARRDRRGPAAQPRRAEPGKRKTQPRRRQPEIARAALLGAGRELFNTVGYFATNSNAIAKAAGYAPGTFYTHFADKMALFLEVYEQWVADEWRAVERGLQGAGKGEARVEAVIRAIAQNHRRSWRFRETLRALSALEPPVRARQNAQRRQQIAWLTALCTREGWREPDTSTCALILLALERNLDALAEGDAEALGATASDVHAKLARMVWLMLE